MNPYETLGIRADASHSEIKGAFRRKAHEYHPDRHGGSADATRALTEVLAAYEAIGTPEARARTDAALRPVAAKPPPSSFEALEQQTRGKPFGWRVPVLLIAFAFDVGLVVYDTLRAARRNETEVV